MANLKQSDKAQDKIGKLAKFPSQNPNPVLRVAKDLTIIYANDASAPLLDYWGCKIRDPLPKNWVKNVVNTLKSNTTTYTEVEHAGQVISLTLSPISDPEQVNIYGHDITNHRKTERRLQQRTHQLGERVKELNCLYGISNLIEKPDITLKDVLQGTTELIPPSWQFPKITCARINLDTEEYRSNNFRETIWKQTGNIMVYGKKSGSVEIFYLEERPSIYEGPFLREERHLINAIAQRLGRIIERKQAEEKIRYLAKFPSENPNPVLRIAKDGTVIYANDASSPLLEFWGCQVNGKLPQDWCAKIYTTLTSGVASTSEVEYQNEVISLTLAPVADLAQVNLYGLDITERVKVEDMKDEFIGLVSHELRTPLTIITGCLSTVYKEWDLLPSVEVRQLLQDATLESEKLSYLIENLLELSRAQSERLILIDEPTDIRILIKKTIEKMKRQAYKHRFLTSIPTGLPHINIDPLRVERILYNLLDNAAKYSDPTTTIRVVVREDSDRFVIGIRDQGKGLSHSDQAMLFKPFERLGKVEHNWIDGIGLGLLVCRRLVEAHGGNIWTKSKPDRGSTFFFSLPITK